MNKYSCTYEKKNAKIVAGSFYEAKLAAIELFNVRKSKRHLVNVWLVEIDTDDPATPCEPRPTFFYD